MGESVEEVMGEFVRIGRKKGVSIMDSMTMSGEMRRGMAALGGGD